MYKNNKRPECQVFCREEDQQFHQQFTTTVNLLTVENPNDILLTMLVKFRD